MYDLLIKNAYALEFNDVVDIAIKGDRIVDIQKHIDSDAINIIEANQRFISPGFVDCHTHLEKALTIDGTESCTLEEAIKNFEKRCERISEEDIRERASKVLGMAVKNGTTAIRTHILVDQFIKLMGIKVLSELKKEYADIIDIQIVAMAPVEGEIIDQENMRLLDEAAKYDIDLYGGSPHLSANPKEQIDLLFELAKKHGLGLDLHIDEKDEPDVSTLEYLVEKTMEEGMQGKVTAGHCVSIAYVSDEIAKPLIEKIKRAGINIVTLPSCNVYLMGRNDKHPISRGVTRVRDFIEAGVNISFASDNIQDPFRPFGNADMLEEALFTAQILQMGTISELNTIFKLGTYNGAKTFGLKDYGIAPSCKADLIVFDAKSGDEAIVTQANKAYIIKAGKIIVENRKETILNSDLLKRL